MRHGAHFGSITTRFGAYYNLDMCQIVLCVGACTCPILSLMSCTELASNNRVPMGFFVSQHTGPVLTH